MSAAGRPRAPMGDLRLALRFALREMRAGLAGFGIFVACIALGVGAIGGVNSVARAIEAGVAEQGQTLLGGDLRFELIHREAGPAERAFLDGLGTVAVSANMRSMALTEAGDNQALVQLKAVDPGLYPLFGRLETTPALPIADLFGERDGAWGATAPQFFFDRLGLKVGDRVRVGSAAFELRAVLLSEPDALSDGFAIAPRLMIARAALDATGLIQPGALVEHVYKVKLAGRPSEPEVEAFKDEAGRRFPEAGWNIRTRFNAAPAISSNVERFGQFLTLVGLTALVVGGVGVANSVRAYLDGKRGVIATFKSLGASGRLVFLTYLAQIGVIAGVGVALGLGVALALPPAAAAALRSFVPVPTEAGVYWDALGLAVLFGVLVTLLFAILPLGRARDVPATALFREQGFDARGWPRRPYLVAAALIGLLLAGAAIGFSGDRRIAAIFVGAMAASFLILRLVSVGVAWAARRSPRTRSTALRLAVGNIHRPGALTPSVVLSLGLGLTLLVALALIDVSLRRQISGNLPARAPDFFFVDIQSAEVDAFRGFMAGEAPRGTLATVPMLRGRIVRLKGVDVEKVAVPPEGAWVLNGDRGLTYSADKPDNATLTEGTWWPADYSGPPLVSFSAEEAGELGLKVGDAITVNVLGRNVTASIASLRQVEWESFGINFVMVFSPNAFAGAPHAWLATLAWPGSDDAAQAKLLNDTTKTFPAVSSVRVKDALDTVNRLVAQIGTAIRAAAAVALIASVLVLAGALAAGNRARVHDAVVLKTLGATRRTLIGAYCLEYGLLGLSTAVFALLAGSASAWFVVSRIMDLPTAFQPEVALGTIAAALVLTVGFGLVGTWRVLGEKAAPVLRDL